MYSMCKLVLIRSQNWWIIEIVINEIESTWAVCVQISLLRSVFMWDTCKNAFNSWTWCLDGKPLSWLYIIYMHPQYAKNVNLGSCCIDSRNKASTNLSMGFKREPKIEQVHKKHLTEWTTLWQVISATSLYAYQVQQFWANMQHKPWIKYISSRSATICLGFFVNHNSF